MSFESLPKEKRPKLHSPAIAKQSWNHDTAMQMVLNHPTHTKINWSAYAKKLSIPGKNTGQVLKEFATQQGTDTLSLEQKKSPMPVRVRRQIKKLPGGDISIPVLPSPHIREKRSHCKRATFLR